MELDTGWQQKLDDWNSTHPNHPPVVIRWEPYAVRESKIVWVAGVSMRRWTYSPRWQVGVLLPSCPPGAEKISCYVEGSGGDWFLKLFNWQTNRGEFLQLDDRIFSILHKGDMTRRDIAADVERSEREHEERSKIESDTAVRDGARYYRGHDNLTVSMNPKIKSGGDWRWRTR